MQAQMIGGRSRLSGRVALVTGASSGIGLAISKALVRHGARVVGTARNIHPIEKAKEELNEEHGTLVGVACDITQATQVESLFEEVKTKYGGVDICINNAGMSFSNTLLDGSPSEWSEMMNLNVIGLCHCAKLSVHSMLERKVDDGHILNVSSVAGHLSKTSAPVHFYAATKHAVRVITEGLRQELREKKSRIRVSSISPGVVETNFFSRMLKDEGLAKQLLSSRVNLTAEDIAKTVMHILTAPSHVEINDVVIRPVEQEQ